MDHTIAVFGASQSIPGDGHYQAALRCGRLLAQAGFGVATGGYSGAMEAVSRGAMDAGGYVIGVTAPTVFPGRAHPNRFLTTEIPADSLVERIGILADSTSGSIALWGSLGTAAELLVAWNLSYVAPLAHRAPKPIIAVGEPWVSLVPHLESVLVTTPQLVSIAPDVDTAVAEMTHKLAS